MVRYDQILIELHGVSSTVGRPFTFGDTLLAAAAGYAICYNRVLVEEFEALNIKRHYY